MRLRAASIHGASRSAPPRAPGRRSKSCSGRCNADGAALAAPVGKSHLNLGALLAAVKLQAALLAAVELRPRCSPPSKLQAALLAAVGSRR